MENLPILYFSLKLIFSGFIFYAVIQSAFIYFKMPVNETRGLLVICSVSFLYIASDALNSIFSIVVIRDNAAAVFLIAREIIPLLFFFIIPYYLDRVLVLKERLKKINRVFFLAGIAIAVILTVFSMIYPDLLLRYGEPGPGLHSGGVLVQYRGPLIISRNIFFFVYLIYLITVILMTAMKKGSRFPAKNVLAGLIVLSYFAFNNFYSVLFARDEIIAVNNHFPYLGLGITILILSMGFGVFDLFISQFGRLDSITKDLRSELYYDAELEIQNRTGFRRDLKIGLDKSATSGRGFSLVYFDIDDFQNINESYGEGFGDEVLRMLVCRLKDTFAEAGALYRIGGDEFSFLLKEISTGGEAGTFASKIISSLKNPFVVSGISCTLTVSIAILIIPRDGNDINTIMSNAYTTIRDVKKAKNSYGFFSKNLLEGASNKIYTVDLLRNCIARDEFVLFYQPIVDAGGNIIHAEALLRCTNNDPAIGGPGNFIPLIEKAGLMKDLDNLVVRKSFYDVEMKIKKRFNISINLSANQLVDPSYGDFLSLFAKQHGIEPRHLVLEITEDNLVENMHLARKSLAELKKSGFLIAIDDFGKGFSSLSYLAELPVDIIKIDMAFVHAVPGDAKKETLAKYIMDLGHSLNLKVVAEGFELPAQVDFFKGLGCDLFQGYYFSRPLPLQDLLAKYFPA